MRSQTHYRLRFKTLVLSAVVLAALLIVGVVVVSAVDPFPGLPNDGRINVVHHFGGDALYCVNDSGSSTDEFDETAAMKLLNIDGTQLWSVTIADIEAAIAAAQAAPGTGIEVFSGPGTYGPASLYVTLDPDGDLTFTFVAYDEWGKSNAMTFEGCGPVGPIGSAISGAGICGDFDGDEYVECVENYCYAAIGCTSGDDDTADILACTEEDYVACLDEFGVGYNPV